MQEPEGVDDTAYSATWSVVRATDLIGAVAGQFESWLRSRGAWDPSTATSGYRIGPQGEELLVVHRDAAEGQSLRLRLIEPRGQGIWRTSVTVSQSRRGNSWVGVRVASAVRTPAKVPRLAVYLLDALELRDGDTWLSSKPRRVSGPAVEQVAAEVTDMGRHGLYLVAGTDDSMPFAAFADQVERWTTDTRGMAQVVVLDPSATREFATIVGRSHEVPPWTIRTFDTDVDPAVSGDGRRHRILGTRRLAGSDGAVRAILGRVARVHAAQRSLPAHFAPIDRALTRMEDELLVDALRQAPEPEGETRDAAERVMDAGPATQAVAVPPGHAPLTGSVHEAASRYLAQVELVEEVLGIETVDRAALSEIRRVLDRTSASTGAIDRITRQLDERRERIEALELDLVEVRKLSDDQEIDLADALVTQAKLVDEVRWLRRRLAEQGSPEGSHVALPDEEESRYPSDFVELSDMIGGLESKGVVFTGDAETVCELADQDPVGRMARVAWDCLLAVCDYIRARQSGMHSQGLRQYLDSTPQGYRGVPRKKFAAKETAATMKAWGDQRAFTVPVSVHPSGEVQMEAHFKLIGREL